MLAAALFLYLIALVHRDQHDYFFLSIRAWTEAPVCCRQLSTSGLMSEIQSKETPTQNPHTHTLKKRLQLPVIPRINLFINNYKKIRESGTRQWLMSLWRDLWNQLNSASSSYLSSPRYFQSVEMEQYITHSISHSLLSSSFQLTGGDF